MQQDTTKTATPVPDLKSLEDMTLLIYILQAASFVVGITYIVAIVLNYIRLKDVQGTWLASHFRWQIRTFWFSLLWMGVGLLTFMFVIGYLVLFANMVWVIYRIARGWVYLNDRKAMGI